MPRNAQVFVLEPSGLLDTTSARVQQFAGKEVQKVQPAGCPRNGTMGQCYVQETETGQFIGMVNEASLRRTSRTAPLRDLAAEARELRSLRFRGRRA
jgi:hypothetical protein